MVRYFDWRDAVSPAMVALALGLGAAANEGWRTDGIQAAFLLAAIFAVVGVAFGAAKRARAGQREERAG